MTDTMLEKMARAMHEWRWLPVDGAATPSIAMPSWSDLPQWQRDRRIGDARAALQAIREPTDAMINAADDGVSCTAPAVDVAFTARIDAILSGDA